LSSLVRQSRRFVREHVRPKKQKLENPKWKRKDDRQGAMLSLSSDVVGPGSADPTCQSSGADGRKSRD
jgi:hypothetical protein